MTDHDQRFREEQARIKELLASAPGRDPIRLPAALKELHTLLTRHCSFEEAPGGLFDRVIRRSPELRPRIEKLRAEHTTLLAELLQLSYRRTTDERMREAVAAFRQRLDEHEDQERELLGETLPGEGAPARRPRQGG